MIHSIGTLETVLLQMPGASTQLKALTGVDASILSKVHVIGLDTSDLRDGLFVDARLTVGGELFVPVPGLSFMTLGLATDASGQTPLHAAVFLGTGEGARSRFRLFSTEFVLRLALPQLQRVSEKRVSAKPDAAPVGPFEVRLRGELDFDSSLKFEPNLESFSVPRFTIVGTGFELELLECQLDLSEETTPAAIVKLGFSRSFRGIYASRARLSWLPELKINGVSGLHLEFADLAVGSEGVSFNFVQTFRIDRKGQGLLPTSELSGSFIDPSWVLALEEITAKVRKNVPSGFSVKGLIQIPLFSSPLAVRLELKKQEDGTVTALTVTHPKSSPPLSLAGGIFTAKEISLTGIVQPGELSFEGTLKGLTVAMGPLKTTISLATLAFKHSESVDALNLIVKELPLGVLGTLSDAEFSFEDTRGLARTQVVAVKGFLKWDTLAASKLAFPHLVKAPPAGSMVEAHISFTDSGANTALEVQLKLVLDLDLLFQPLARDLRPIKPRLEATVIARFASGSTLTDGSKPELELDGTLFFRPPKAWNDPTRFALSVLAPDGELSVRIRANNDLVSLSANASNGLGIQLAGLFGVSLSEASFSVSSKAWSIAAKGEIIQNGGLLGGFALGKLKGSVAASSGTGRLVVGVEGKVPFSLPAIGSRPASKLFDLTSVGLTLDVVKAAFEVSAAVTLAAPPAQGKPDLVTNLGLDLVRPMASELTKAMRGPKITLTLGGEHLGTDEATATARLTFSSAGASSISLMDVLGRIASPSRTTPGRPKLDRNGTVIELEDFFDATPGDITLALQLGKTSSLTLSASLNCKLFKEEFDASVSASFDSTGNASMSLELGMTDPFRLIVPNAPPTLADVDKVADLYGIPKGANNPQRAALRAMSEQLNGIFSSPEDCSPGILEFSQVGISFDTKQGFDIHGTVQLVQTPEFLRGILPSEGPRMTLGVSQDSFHVRLETDSAKPLVHLPFGTSDKGEAQFVEFFLYSFELRYAFTSNAIQFGMEANITATPRNLLNASAFGTGVKVVTPLAASLRIGTTVTVPPIPVPEWSITYGTEQTSPQANATDEMGLQYFAGIDAPGLPRVSIARYYVQDSVFSLSYLPMCPGMSWSGGWILGGPPAEKFRKTSKFSAKDHYFDALLNGTGDAKDTVYAHFAIEKGVVLLVNPAIAAVLNPLVFVPLAPPMPPFWIPVPYSGSLVDFFVKKISASFHVMNVIHCSFSFERPLPTFSLQMLLESAALVSQGFSVPIPDDSPLRALYFSRLELIWDFPFLFPAGRSKSSKVVIDVCLVDVINGIIGLVGTVQKAVEDASDLLNDLLKDPEALLLLVPPSARVVTFDLDTDETAIEILNFKLSGSLALLTRQELLDELVLYHESKRTRKVGPSGMVPQPPPPPKGAPIGVVLPQPLLPKPFPGLVAKPGKINLNDKIPAREWTRRDPKFDRFGGRVIARDAAIDAEARLPLAKEVLAFWTKTLSNRLLSQESTVKTDLKTLGFDEAGAERALQFIPWSKPLTKGSVKLETHLAKFRDRHAFFQILIDELERSRAAIPPKQFVIVALQSETPSSSGIKQADAKAVSATGTGSTAKATTSAKTTPAPVSSPQSGSPVGAPNTNFQQDLSKGLVGDRRLQLLSDPRFKLTDRMVKRVGGERIAFRGDENLSLFKRKFTTVPILPALPIPGLPPSLGFNIVLKDGSEPDFKVPVARETTPFSVRKLDGIWRIVVREKRAAKPEDPAVPTNVASRLNSPPPNRNLPHVRLVVQRCLTVQRTPLSSNTAQEELSITLRPDPKSPSQLKVKVTAPKGSLVLAERLSSNIVIQVKNGEVVVHSETVPREMVLAALNNDAAVGAVLRDQFEIPASKMPGPGFSLTNAQAARVDTSTPETGTDLYQQSLFARPEYYLADNEKFHGLSGTHGVFSLADILFDRDKGPTDPARYRIPPGPSMVAGLRVELGDNSVALAGFISVGQGKIEAFLSGRHAMGFEFGPWKFSVDGEVTLLAGDLWSDGIGDLDADSLNARGALRVKYKDDLMFESEAFGKIKAKDGAISEILLGFKADFDLQIEIGFETNLRVSLSSNLGSSLTVKNGTFSATGSATLKFNVEKFEDGEWEPSGLPQFEVDLAFTAGSSGISVSAGIHVKGNVPLLIGFDGKPVSIADVISTGVDAVEFFAQRNVIDWVQSGEEGVLTLQVGGLN